MILYREPIANKLRVMRAEVANMCLSVSFLKVMQVNRRATQIHSQKRPLLRCPWNWLSIVNVRNQPGHRVCFIELPKCIGIWHLN